LATAAVAVLGVAAIVTLVSFGLGLQQNIIGQALSKLDVFTSITVRGASADALLELSEGRAAFDEGENAPPPENKSANATPEPTEQPEQGDQNPFFSLPRRTLDDVAIAEIQKFNGVKYALPVINFSSYIKFDRRVRRNNSD